MGRTQQIPESYPGFEEINRFIDVASGECTADLRPGEFYVTRNNEMVTTVLGSCVAACVRDRKTRVGGMNHFLLPADRAAGESWSSAARYGSYAMEALINEVLKHGGARNRLEIKLFGGARMVAGLSDVGQQNIEFVQKYLRTEQLSPDVEDVGGDRARVVQFWPATGAARVKRVKNESSVIANESQYRQRIGNEGSGGSVELF